MALDDRQRAAAPARYERLLRVVRAFPEVADEDWGLGHHVFKVGKKSFAYYLRDHHGDGKLAFCCKSTKAEQRVLVREDPARHYVPAYLGPSGWVAVRLDLEDVDWEAIRDLAEAAWLHVAPKRLADRYERA